MINLYRRRPEVGLLGGIPSLNSSLFFALLDFNPRIVFLAVLNNPITACSSSVLEYWRPTLVRLWFGGVIHTRRSCQSGFRPPSRRQTSGQVRSRSYETRCWDIKNTKILFDLTHLRTLGISDLNQHLKSPTEFNLIYEYGVGRKLNTAKNTVASRSSFHLFVKRIDNLFQYRLKSRENFNFEFCRPDL